MGARLLVSFLFFKQKTAYEIGLGIPAEPLFRSARSGAPPTYQRRAPLRLPLVPRNGCGRPGRAPERFLPLRSEERRVGKEGSDGGLGDEDTEIGRSGEGREMVLRGV